MSELGSIAKIDNMKPATTKRGGFAEPRQRYKAPPLRRRNAAKHAPRARSTSSGLIQDINNSKPLNPVTSVTAPRSDDPVESKNHSSSPLFEVALNEVPAPENQPHTDGARPDLPKLGQLMESRLLANLAALKATSQSLFSKVKLFEKLNMSYALAAVLFIFGMYVTVNGFILNKKADHQVAVLETESSAVLGDSTGAAGEPVSQYGNGHIPSEASVSKHEYDSYQVAADSVRYIRIPSIGATSRVLSVGNTSEGAVDTPYSIYDVGLYEQSAKITDSEGAIFAVGHVSGLSKVGIFYNLKDLKKGDIVEAELGDGTVKKFKVTERSRYSIGEVDMQKALTSSRAGALGLNLMTCGGDFDSEEFSFTERVLVRTVEI